MVFSSVVFLFVFLPIVLLIYFIAPRKLRNAVLLVASLVFYAWGEPVYIVLMVASTVVAYLAGLGIDAAIRQEETRRAKRILLAALAIHLGCLLFFKYTDFFIENFNRLGLVQIPQLHLALPIGISFYTFQILSYIVDVYWGKVAVQRHWVNLATYVALFPQLIAGPIVRYETVEEEMQNRQESVEEFAQGAQRFIVGLGKKVLIANTVGELYTIVHDLPHSQQSVLMLWLAAVAYTIQIYYDFSGYSDMAIGLGRMFGFHFLENFEYPYIAASITEFWRRWHISLSSWFRDYVYIPLGGNRKGRLCQYRNIFIVWFLTGFWHGAEWTFILWGLYFCLFLMLEKAGLLQFLQKLPAFVRHLYTLVLVVLSWTIFSANSIGELGNTLRGMFFLDDLSVYNDRTVYYLVSYGVLLLFAVIGATPLPRRWYAAHLQTAGNSDLTGAVRVGRQSVEIVLTFALFLVSVAYLVSASFNPFLYFRF